MIETVLIILAVIAVILALLAGVVALQPAGYKVERSAAIAAPPADVFAQVNDFHKWDAWSPWVKIDPNAKGTFEGPETGQGAIFRWDGNKHVGAGSMTITDSQPNDHIKIKIEFLRPFKGGGDVEFRFKEQIEKTVVTWSMSGQHSFIGKAMCLVFSMDKMIGGKYEEGLATMKAIVEAEKTKAHDGKKAP